MTVIARMINVEGEAEVIGEYPTAAEAICWLAADGAINIGQVEDLWIGWDGNYTSTAKSRSRLRRSHD